MPKPRARTEHTTTPQSRPTRNRRVNGDPPPAPDPPPPPPTPPTARPMSASTRISPPGKNTLSFLEFTSARAPAVIPPHTRFSEEAARNAAGPAEYVSTSLSVRLAVGYSSATFRYGRA